MKKYTVRRTWSQTLLVRSAQTGVAVDLCPHGRLGIQDEPAAQAQRRLVRCSVEPDAHSRLHRRAHLVEHCSGEVFPAVTKVQRRERNSNVLFSMNIQ